MSTEKFSPQQQQELVRLQQMQQQVEMIIQQRVNLEAQSKELELAIKELEAAGAESICYKSVGGLLIKADQSALLQESKDKKDTMEMRVKSLQNQEERIKKSFEEQRSKIQKMLKE
jgi:prefoldin beta subunit